MASSTSKGNKNAAKIKRVIEAVVPELADEFIVWQLVFEGVALQELETTWSLDDIIRASTLLEIKGLVQDLYISGAPDGK